MMRKGIPTPSGYEVEYSVTTLYQLFLLKHFTPTLFNCHAMQESHANTVAQNLLH
jgi:hypothetical protein